MADSPRELTAEWQRVFGDIMAKLFEPKPPDPPAWWRWNVGLKADGEKLRSITEKLAAHAESISIDSTPYWAVLGKLNLLGMVEPGVVSPGATDDEWDAAHALTKRLQARLTPETPAPPKPTLRRGPPTKHEEDAALLAEWRSGQYKTKAAMARAKGKDRSTISAAIARAEKRELIPAK